MAHDRRTPRLTRKRLLGLDRSGPAPRETLSGQPWRPWTIPNAIGYVRLTLIPTFLAVALMSRNGRDVTAAIIFAVAAGSDYLDGIAARLTGQYSRLGAFLDPLIDRLLVVAGIVVCWHFNLLSRYALAVLLAREIFMLGLGRFALAKKLELKVNWIGRWGVWPVMAAPFLALVGASTAAQICLYSGVLFMLAATVLYVRDGRRELTAGKSK